MTKSTEVAEDTGVHNRAMRLEAIRALDQLIATATKPDFSGVIGVEFSIDRGKIRRLKTAVESYKQ